MVQINPNLRTGPAFGACAAGAGCQEATGMEMTAFTKYHALGNDYLVLDPGDCPELPSPRDIRLICHRHYGLGSDGILFGPLEAEAGADFGLRILNPDGSEAEKSGNGLRIFARYLHDNGRVGAEPFRVSTPGGVVECVVDAAAGMIAVEMGRVSFAAAMIPVTGEPREVINETITAAGREFTFCAATIGNPHCVLPVDKLSADLATTYGPHIERDARFPNRTNVQFMKVLDRRNIQIEIWERGAGYTLASGSSSSAAGAVARKLGLVDAELTVHMPGGRIGLRIDEAFAVTMSGPATPVGPMRLHPEALRNPAVE